MSNYETKDSGRRQDYITGARRDIEDNKGRFDLIPYEPELRWAQLLERGARKSCWLLWLSRFAGSPGTTLRSSISKATEERISLRTLTFPERWAGSPVFIRSGSKRIHRTILAGLSKRPRRAFGRFPGTVLDSES